MTWTNEIFQARHGEVGVAAASALVSGLGNLGSVVTTYALYTGWESDRLASGKEKYRKSNWVMIAMLFASIFAAGLMEVLLRFFGGSGKDLGSGSDDGIGDGAARREAEQRGFRGMRPFKIFSNKRR